MDAWTDTELQGCDLGDARLDARLGAIIEAVSERAGESLPAAFQDWASTKAAYRFFENEKVSEEKILAGHLTATRLRIEAVDGPILVLQDTTEFTFKRRAPEKIGFTKASTGRKMKDGRFAQHTVCGLLMHASLAVTPEGLPLGLTAAKFWSRDKLKGTNALKRKVNPTRIPIEAKESVRWLDNLRQSTELIGQPERCVHIGDRESDIYELFCLAEALGTKFLVRSCVDRLAGDGATTLTRVMQGICPSGTHTVEFTDTSGQAHQATLSVKFSSMVVRPPIGKQKHYPHQSLRVIHAQEIDPPDSRPPIDWRLITNLEVACHEEAVRMLAWYARRWSIETFFKTLKTGCRIEQVRLTSAPRLANFIALCCIVAWRVHWLTMLQRHHPGAAPSAVFTAAEITCLDALTYKTSTQEDRSLHAYMLKLARLGGYLARKGDPPPGATVIWRGLTRLADRVEGMGLAQQRR